MSVLTLNTIYRFLIGSLVITSLAACSGASPEPLTAPTEPQASSTRVVIAEPTDTASPLATNTTKPLPTDTSLPPTETSIPPTTTPDVPAFEVLQPVTFKEQYSSYLSVIGIIKYAGSVPRMSPEIVVTLTDDTGKVLATEQAYTAPRYIRPGSNIPYKVSMSNAPEKWAKIEVEIEAEEFGGYMANVLYPDLEIAEPSLKQPANEFSGQQVVGRIKNVGKANSQYAQITGALYGADGALLDVVNAYGKKEKIAIASDSPFELDFRRGVLGTTFELFVDGNKDQ